MTARMYNLAMQFEREATLLGVPLAAPPDASPAERAGICDEVIPKAEVAQDIRPVFNARSPDEARRILADIVEKYIRPQSRLSAWMDDDSPEGLTVFAFPEAVRQLLRNNSMEENLNRQIRQRTRLIPAFPNVDTLLRLTGAIYVETGDERETNGCRYMSAIKEL